MQERYSGYLSRAIPRPVQRLDGRRTDSAHSAQRILLLNILIHQGFDVVLEFGGKTALQRMSPNTTEQSVLRQKNVSPK
jgi:hypothetical protein